MMKINHITCMLTSPQKQVHTHMYTVHHQDIINIHKLERENGETKALKWYYVIKFKKFHDRYTTRYPQPATGTHHVLTLVKDQLLYLNKIHFPNMATNSLADTNRRQLSHHCLESWELYMKASQQIPWLS